MGKALVLENDGDIRAPNLKTVQVFEQKDLAKNILGPTPGPCFNSVGSARSAVEQTDWHDQAERHFSHNWRSISKKRLRSGKTKSLIIVAWPRALGMIRPAYSHAVKGAVRMEVDKDLVKMPVTRSKNV